MPILRFQVEGFRVCKDGSAKGCHGNGLTLMTGRGEVVWELVWDLRSMGGEYSEDHTIQVDLVVAQNMEIGVAREVLREAECRPWYR